MSEISPALEPLPHAQQASCATATEGVSDETAGIIHALLAIEEQLDRIATHLECTKSRSEAPPVVAVTANVPDDDCPAWIDNLASALLRAHTPTNSRPDEGNT